MNSIRTLVIAVTLCLLASAGWAGRGDVPQHSEGRAAAKGLSAALGGGVCDSLIDRKPGLFGLCLAYCKASELEPSARGIDADKLEHLAARKEKVLERYNAERGEDDPEMPCIHKTACPCWGGEQTSTAFWLEKSRAPQCQLAKNPPVVQSRLSGGSDEGGDSANMLARVDAEQSNGLCFYTDQANGTRTVQFVSESDAMVCSTQIDTTCSLLP